MGRKQNRSESHAESLTVRMSARTRYGLELLARRQRRTLASLIEWLGTEALHNQSLTTLTGESKPVTQALDDGLWDPLEPDRVIALARRHTDLLAYDEQLVWKVIMNEPSFWKFKTPPAMGSIERLLGSRVQVREVADNTYEFGEPEMKRIRAQWDNIRAAANGEPVDFTKQTNKEG